MGVFGGCGQGCVMGGCVWWVQTRVCRECVCLVGADMGVSCGCVLCT